MDRPRFGSDYYYTISSTGTINRGEDASFSTEIFSMSLGLIVLKSLLEMGTVQNEQGRGT